MSRLEMGIIEGKLAKIIWDNAPINSGELVKLAEKELGWKKSTTYSVLKKFCERGLFRNEKATVTVLISEEEYRNRVSREFIDESFGGSLPAFLAAFSGGKKLKKKEVEEIKKLLGEI